MGTSLQTFVELALRTRLTLYVLLSSSSFNNIFNTVNEVDINDTNTLALGTVIGCFCLHNGNKMFDTFYKDQQIIRHLVM